MSTDVLFHGSWPRPGPEWNNPNLKNIIDPIFAVRDSVVDALGSHSPSQFGVIIYASPLLMKCVEVSCDYIKLHNVVLCMLVVHQIDLLQ